MPDDMTLDEYHRLIRRPVTPATYRASEAAEQIALFQWIDLVTPREPRLAYALHVPNGELRERAVAGRLKAMGVRPGVPDILILVPSRRFVGLAIELKTDRGVASIEQVTWVERLRDVGWAAVVIVGWMEAARHICWYLERDPEDMGLMG